MSGPFIGAALSSVSFEAPFLLTGTMLAVLGPVAAVLITRSPIAAAPVDYSDLRALLLRPRVQAAICVHISVWGLVGVFDSTVDRYMTDVGLSATEFAIGLMVIGIPLIALPPHAGALAERIGGGRVAVPALALFVPSVLLYGWVGGVWTFIIIGLAEAATESYGAMGSQVLILEATGVERAATGSGLLEAVGLTMAAVTALAGPPLYGEVGPRWLFGGWGRGVRDPVGGRHLPFESSENPTKRNYIGSLRIASMRASDTESSEPGRATDWRLVASEAAEFGRRIGTVPVLVLLGAVAAAVAAGFLFGVRHGTPEPIELPHAAAEAPPPVATTQPSLLQVHLAGAVQRAGLYEVPASFRVGDLVDAAGGFTAEADGAAVNLAERLRDGQQIYVPTQGEALTTESVGIGGAGGDGRIDVNAATATQLEQLPGIGPSLAGAIVAFRNEHGPFATVDALQQVPGIGPSKLAQLRDRASV